MNRFILTLTGNVEVKMIEEAGNGLLSRRFFLAGTSVALMAATAGAGERGQTTLSPGTALSPEGLPDRNEKDNLQRTNISSAPGTSGTGVSRTPLEHLDGIVTPSRLHFERHHSGVPDINPDTHRLVVYGLVDRPLMFDLNRLMRYPMVSRMQFLECAGNSGALTAPTPVEGTCGNLHGLISNSEWGGVPISVLLDEAGVKPTAQWAVADGADSAMMSRSIPLSKLYDDAIVALYQNGEPIRPSNGYPFRLFLPGWEGNMSVKWLRSIKVTSMPAMTKDETSKYSDLRDDGYADLFTYPMAVKSVITNPSPGLSLYEKGVYQISGLAWSGLGQIKKVEVSADGGKSWAEALLDAHVLDKSVTRFRIAWRWSGGAASLISRAFDSQGAIQPTRSEAMSGRGPGSFYHYNGQQAWRGTTDGSVRNVYV